MQASVEADFAAAVLFLQTYNGPHRILRNPASSIRVEFDALFHQATLGPCTSGAPMDGQELASWKKWKSLGAMEKEDAMQKYIKTMDDLVDNWRRTASFRGPPSSTSSSTPTPQTLIERLPSLVSDVDDIKARIHFDSQRHEELSEALNTLSYDTKTTFTREMRQVDLLRHEMLDTVQRLERQVQEQKVQIASLASDVKDMTLRMDTSIFFRVQHYGLVAWRHAVRWSSFRVTHVALAWLTLILVWRHIFKSKLPRFIADPLIAAIASLARRPPQTISH
ncbi:Aste57867_13974 [Aphanomyces stellatus]|uniref:Aste57867_13974 protein n=1 Tax=Aphanomyces stellatus TaxID=120398 RepID=A0A485L1R1_9STRA|nr:hypothetical protein As57867_013923 [Aphanomyces stellatus]VFT90804.1 Aste57867_13974 [Aphanomyces stellatus]